jgi:hypothetical protein
MTATVGSETIELQASLDAFARLPEWLASAMQPEVVAGSLRRHVPALAAGELQLLACVPQRLRAKADQWLARYQLTVGALNDELRDVVLVGNLYAPSAEVPDDVDLASPSGDLGVDDWTCWLPDLRLRLHRETADNALPALPALVDPDTAARVLADVLRGAGYGDVSIVDCRPDVVRYKPGSRCTVVVRLTYDDSATNRQPPPLVVMKTHQGDKGRTAWEAMTALWAQPVAHEGVVSLAEPLAYFAEERILVQGPLAEDRTLKVLARDAIADGRRDALDLLRAELAKTARALAALHHSGATYGATATFAGELAEVQELIDRLAITLPELGGAARPLLSRLTDLAEQFPAEDVVPAHHDFRPAQVLLSGGGVGFIDFDGAAMAEPAFDLGRFRAKLRDIGITVLTAAGKAHAPDLAEHLALMDELCGHFTHAYRQHSPVSVERVQLWETIDLVTAMLHAWTKVRLLRVEPRLIVLRHAVDALGALH